MANHRDAHAQHVVFKHVFFMIKFALRKSSAGAVNWEMIRLFDYLFSLLLLVLVLVLHWSRHAQAAMSRICCEHTVIIGHALHNDLESLKVNPIIYGQLSGSFFECFYRTVPLERDHL